jgi:hypothetical protein
VESGVVGVAVNFGNAAAGGRHGISRMALLTCFNNILWHKND